MNAVKFLCSFPQIMALNLKVVTIKICLNNKVSFSDKGPGMSNRLELLHGQHQDPDSQGKKGEGKCEIQRYG